MQFRTVGNIHCLDSGASWEAAIQPQPSSRMAVGQSNEPARACSQACASNMHLSICLPLVELFTHCDFLFSSSCMIQDGNSKFALFCLLIRLFRPLSRQIRSRSTGDFDAMHGQYWCILHLKCGQCLLQRFCKGNLFIGSKAHLLYLRPAKQSSCLSL